MLNYQHSREGTPVKEDDVQAVATALQAYDETVTNKSWRDLAIVAISAMAARDYQVQRQIPVCPDGQDIVVKVTKNVRPRTFGEQQLLDEICSVIMGEKAYQAWLDSEN